jgi:hypothetical protein
MKRIETDRIARQATARSAAGLRPGEQTFQLTLTRSRPRPRLWWLLVCASALVVVGGCSKAPDAEATAEANAANAALLTKPAKVEPVITPHPTTEDGVLQAFTQALELQDLPGLKRVIAPELAAELTRLHDLNQAEFWARGGIWVENAKTGMSIATRGDDAFKSARWRALVRFGNGLEETVEFTQLDGKLLLAEP